MRLYCTLHVESRDQEVVERTLCEALGFQDFARQAGDFPEELYGKEFLPDGSLPTMLAIGPNEGIWTPAHFNSFVDLGEAASAVSTSIRRRVAMVLTRIEPPTAAWALHSGGKRVRLIHLVGGRSFTEGTPLPFESESVAAGVTYHVEPTDIVPYCFALGLPSPEADWPREGWLVRRRPTLWGKLFGG